MSDSDYEPPDMDDLPVVSGEKQQRRTLRTNKPVDYTGSATDDFFADQKGYTSFGRTRRGGDRRPRAAGTNKKSVTLPSGCRSLLHFFQSGRQQTY